MNIEMASYIVDVAASICSGLAVLFIAFLKQENTANHAHIGGTKTQ